jgi:glycosyltransferase involved in cell wall biosynthesis
VVHVTHFNRMMWDNGVAPTEVVEHGIVDPGPLYTGRTASLAAVVNEPVRRGRIAGTDLPDGAGRGAAGGRVRHGMDQLAAHAPHMAGRLHENYPQERLHGALGAHRAYFHPYRWTSLGLALLEAMTIGMPVLGLSTTEAPRAVPPGRGLLSNDPEALAAQARRWLDDHDAAAAAGTAAREHA